MKRLLPLKRAVVELTQEARPDCPEEIRRAVRSWHNRLNCGSVPRRLIAKVGRTLFLDLDAWEEYLAERSQRDKPSGPGRPRSD